MATRKAHLPTVVPENPTPIEPDVWYTRDHTKKLTGWSEEAIQAAFRNGLKRSRVHGRVYVHGQSIIDYLKRFQVEG